MRRILITITLLLASLGSYASQYQTGVAVPVVWMLQDATGDAIADVSPTIAYKRLTDGYWYSWTEETWQATRDASCETEMNDDEAAIGVYTFRITPASTEFSDADYVAYASASAETLYAAFDFTVTSIIVDATVVLGDGTTRLYADATDTTYQITTSGGSGIDMVFVRAYTTADWTANRRSAEYVRAVDYTDPNGYWDLYLTAGTSYTILFTKQGVIEAYTITVTPS